MWLCEQIHFLETSHSRVLCRAAKLAAAAAASSSGQFVLFLHSIQMLSNLLHLPLPDVLTMCGAKVNATLSSLRHTLTNQSPRTHSTSWFISFPDEVAEQLITQGIVIHDFLSISFELFRFSLRALCCWVLPRGCLQCCFFFSPTF